jgi:hypothetical protein
MDTLRTINFDEKHFECGGRKFYIQDSLSFNRYRELQKLNLEFGFSVTFLDHYKHLVELYELLNQTKFADAAVKVHNMIYGTATLDDKEAPALRMCALFINETGEDVTVYDKGKMSEKIECWSKELDVLPFFQLAVNLVEGWMAAYQNIIHGGISQGETETSS